MAPKKKVKNIKGIKSLSGIIDSVSVSEMSREQLEIFLAKIQQELEKEREERNYFCLERDKIKIFWDITKQHADQYQIQFRNKDKELEETKKKNHEEIKTYQQNIKYLMYEQHTELLQMKVEGIVTLKNAEQDFLEQEQKLLCDKRELKSQITENEKGHLNQLKSLQNENNAEISKLRIQYENNCRELEYKYQMYMEQTREELMLKNEIKTFEIEERKNKCINELLEVHNCNYYEAINFYTEITAKNLALVSILKEKLKTTQNKEFLMIREIQNTKNQNKKFIKPLKIAQESIKLLQKKVDVLKRNEKCCRIFEKELKTLKMKYENLKFLYDSLYVKNFKEIKEI